ncbi:MAG: sugar ABC transporter substrate-binding protein, partial [Planctomycetota bacterium]|nr:sugar ABC transporter substrate-binding protein [Planctomycetota bacterium]
MKVEIFDRLMAAQVSRRKMLQGAASAAAVAAGAAVGLGGLTRSSFAQSSIRAEILRIPGVGVGSPGDSDWQKVGALSLEPTKANVTTGEFAGVELTFLGLNNQNLHNFLFRGFLKPWE